ncbi:MAG TPA: phage tail assembly chaperone [Caulobacteraceae bacterium]
MTPWAAMLPLAVSMGITPREFWRLSLREWRALVGDGGEVLGRAGFEELVRRYPDE